MADVPKLLPWSQQLAVREAWLEKRHGMLLEQMRRHGMGMWVIVNEEFVRRFLDGREPIGQRFSFGPGGDRTIVGVVGEVRVRGLERRSEPQVYMAAPQMRDCPRGTRLPFPLPSPFPSPGFGPP